MSELINEEPIITKVGLASLQVCVPKEWTDSQVVKFANEDHPSGLDNGWSIRRQGDPSLDGANERVACEGRADCVHVMLDC